MLYCVFVNRIDHIKNLIVLGQKPLQERRLLDDILVLTRNVVNLFLTRLHPFHISGKGNLLILTFGGEISEQLGETCPVGLILHYSKLDVLAEVLPDLVILLNWVLLAIALLLLIVFILIALLFLLLLSLLLFLLLFSFSLILGNILILLLILLLILRFLFLCLILHCLFLLLVCLSRSVLLLGLLCNLLLSCLLCLVGQFLQKLQHLPDQLLLNGLQHLMLLQHLSRHVQGQVV
mmetsp:Transcript_39229/g.63605  ORF Transcript_39229/g.63605 Transcript_39229/m.63605 type:complete len:235 (-) Transcript_39229:1455-2159(-)